MKPTSRFFVVWFIVIKWNHHHRRWAFIHAYIYVLPELVLHPRPSPIGKAKCIKIFSTIILILLHFLYYKMLTKPGSRKPTRILNYTWYNQVIYAHFVIFSSPQGKDVMYVTNFLLFFLRKIGTCLWGIEEIFWPSSTKTEKNNANGPSYLTCYSSCKVNAS